MDKWTIQQTVDLNDPESIVDARAIPLGLDDYRAHDWRVTIQSSGAPADLSGYGARVFYTVESGDTYVGSATVDGHIVTATVPQAVYQVPGQATATLKLYQGATESEKYMTVAIRTFSVLGDEYRRVYATEGVLVDYTDLVQRVSELETLVSKLEASAGMRSIRLEDIENLYIQPTTPTVAEYPGLQTGDIWIKT